MRRLIFLRCFSLFDFNAPLSEGKAPVLSLSLPRSLVRSEQEEEEVDDDALGRD